jgi:undecaprenyl-diphosphatase
VVRRVASFADQLALRHVVKSVPEPAGRTITSIGRVASGGALWFGSAGLVALTGSKGRRAAGRGLVAYGAASALANGPAKWVARRARPSGVILKDLPRIGTRPSTSSFPSAHTASATAFAVAASGSFPAVAPVLGSLAATVALSRVIAVRHFPTDVVAGAALGAGVGVAVHLAGSGGNRAASPGPREETDDAA